MSNPMNNLVLIEWDTDGHWCRAVYETRPATEDRLGYYQEYNVNWCKRVSDHYVDDVGCGPGPVYLDQLVKGVVHVLWLAEGTKCRRNTMSTKGVVSPDEIRALGYLVLHVCNTPKDPVAVCKEASCSWCAVSDDMLPENDEHCEHMEWCDFCGAWNINETCVHSGKCTDCGHSHDETEREGVAEGEGIVGCMYCECGHSSECPCAGCSVRITR